MKELVEFIAQSLVSKPDQVMVETSEREGVQVIALRVDQEDLGTVIGRRGRTASALRTLVSAAAARTGQDVQVEIRD